MKLVTPDSDQVRLGLRAMKTLIESKSQSPQLRQLEYSLLDAVQRTWGTAHDIPTLPTITPQELADGLVDPGLRRQLIAGLAALALIDGEGQESEIAWIRECAAALDVPDRVTQVMRHHSAGHFRWLQFDLARRSWVPKKIREEVWPEEGFWGLARIVRQLVNSEDPKIAARYRALEHYPQGTLGRAYWEHMTSNGFGLPGEKGAPPELIVLHDCIHVLTGYNTDPAGETQIAGFYIGFVDQDPTDHLLFIMMQFHLGVQVTPVAKPERGYFDPEAFLRAVKRGAAMNINLNDHWDPWTVFDQPLDELRKRYNILPA